MKKLWAALLIALFVVVGAGSSNIVQAHTGNRLADILDDFPLNTTLRQDNISKYYNPTMTIIERNGSKLTSIKFNTSSGSDQEIEVIITDESKIAEIRICFFIFTQDANVLNTYYSNLLPIVSEYYGKPLKERDIRFFSPTGGKVKQAYFNEDDKYHYFFGAFLALNHSAANSPRGVMFQIQSTGYYSEIW